MTKEVHCDWSSVYSEHLQWWNLNLIKIKLVRSNRNIWLLIIAFEIFWNFLSQPRKRHMGNVPEIKTIIIIINSDRSTCKIQIYKKIK